MRNGGEGGEKIRYSILALIVVLLSGLAMPSVEAQVRAPTTLVFSPSAFTVSSGGSITLTLTLTSNGTPLVGKTVGFSVIGLGSVSPTSGTTDPNGKISVTYTAPVVGVRTSMTVQAAFTGDIGYEASTASSSGTVEPVAVVFPRISVEGAAFTIPESLKDDISAYRGAVPQALPLEVFILAKPENLFLVFAARSDKGIATVDGVILPKSITLKGVSLNVIHAETVSFRKDGEPATIGEILSRPRDYELKLVKVSATRRQVSILYDPDDGSEVEVPVTAGYLVEKPEKIPELIKYANRRARDLIEKPSTTLIKDILQAEEPRLPLFDFEFDYWIDCPAETNGIVLIPGGILELFRKVVPRIGELVRLEEKPILYDVKTNLIYESVPSVKEINQNPAKYRDKIVGFSAKGFGGSISVQESLKSASGGKIRIPVDVCLEGIIAWNELSLPPKEIELLGTAGASSIHQDTVFQPIDGEFKFVGRIVSTKQIDESLPEGLALVVYSREKIGEIDYLGLAKSARESIESRVHELFWVQTNFAELEILGVPTRPPEVIIHPVRPIFVKTPEELPGLIVIATRFELRVEMVLPDTPIDLKVENSRISRITIDLAKIRENVRMVVEKLERKPPELPEPPGLVWAYIQIDVNVPEDAIENAGIYFWVLKEWLATQGISKENIVLFRFRQGKWSELPTRVIGENFTHIHYSAETPGFSTFAVAAKTAPPEERPAPLPWTLIGGVVGLIVLIAVIAVVLRHRRSSV